MKQNKGNRIFRNKTCLFFWKTLSFADSETNVNLLPVSNSKISFSFKEINLFHQPTLDREFAGSQSLCHLVYLWALHHGTIPVYILGNPGIFISESPGYRVVITGQRAFPRITHTLELGVGICRHFQEVLRCYFQSRFCKR